MAQPSNHEMVKDLHQDLARKWRVHGTKVEAVWRSLNKAERTRCLKAGAAEGVVLKHPLDASMGVVYKYIPEWNLRDITEPGSDFLLDLLKHRATTSLLQQYFEGVNGGPGDRGHIIEMMQKKNLRHVDSFKDSYTFFMDSKYGESVRLVRESEESFTSAFAQAIQAGICVPQSTGELILTRQLYLLQALNIMVEDILEVGSKTRNRKERPKNSNNNAPAAAFSGLSVSDAPDKVELKDVAASARDQRSALEERVDLLRTEPVVLAHVVNITFFSRPELVADEKGRVLPVHTDKHISAGFFEATHNGVQAAAIWAYITRCVELLESSNPDKTYKGIILQEMSNVCHLEYGRAQALFKRHFATGNGSKRFKRMSNVYDKAGNARLNMKCKPEELTRSDPQSHYLLRLCQPETTAAKAVDWMKKLGDLYTAHPLERERLTDREADSLFDLAVITGFIQDLTSSVSLPVASRKKGQAFLTKCQELEVELAPLKAQIDLRDYAAPIDNLLEPGMADNALNAMEDFIIEKAGTKLGYLYQDLIQDCVSDLQNQYSQARAQKKQDAKVEQVPVVAAQEPQEERVEHRRQKEKTRPSQPSAYELTTRASSSPAEVQEPALMTQTLKTSASTTEVFMKLFQKSQARSSVSWASFEAAMAELGFSVFPKYGSVYTFQPPESLETRKPVTLHRPHNGQVEGYRLLILARRLKRTYGWGEKTFQVD
ncbi:hypothetical protein ACHAPT_009175 [Fusarium lateritium]